MQSPDHEFANRTSSQADLGSWRPEPGDEDIVVAEVIDEGPADAGVADDAPENEQPGPADEPAVVRQHATAASGGSIQSQQWHDIQAEFVDDPRTAVRRAVAAADAAIGALAEDLHRQLPDLTASGGDGSGQDTEQLRIAMQRCRELWQGASDLTASSVPGMR